jgi:hypothetical protein
MKSPGIITLDAYSVSPELLGTPLAHPRVRAIGMLVDLAVVGIFIKFIGSLLLPLIAGVLFVRTARPARTGGVLRRNAMRLLRGVAVVLIVASGLQAYSEFSSWLGPADEEEIEEIAEPDAGDEPEFDIEDAGAAVIMGRFSTADDEEEARVEAANLASWVRESSTDPAEQARRARFLLASLERTTHGPLLREALLPFSTTVPDTAEVARLRRLANAYQAQNADLRERLAESRERGGIRRFIAGFADDLGVGFGWFALYFTTCLVFMKGQTPGKRLMRTRVIRLDGKPIGWWLAFERFGGYAASFSTGLLGFAQILWDRNRQGLHDKAADTVVIQLPRNS